MLPTVIAAAGLQKARAAESETNQVNVSTKLITIATGSVLTVAAVSGGFIVLNPSFGTSASAAPSVLSLLQQTAPQSGTTPQTRAAQQDAYLQRLANNLGISLDALKSALKTTSLQELDARVADGTLTQAQADQIRSEIQNGTKLIFGLGGGEGFGRGHGGPGEVANLQAIATFLGVDPATLGSQLSSGTTLAQAAQAAGKTREQLKTFLTDQAKTALDQKVASGQLTQAQADAKLAQLTANLDAMIDRADTDVKGGPGGHGPEGPEGADDSGAAPATPATPATPAAPGTTG